MDINSKMTVPEEVAERLPILHQQENGDVTSVNKTAVYTRRWFVLFIFQLASFAQACVWNTWGPITESSEAIFNWDDGNIGMLANYGNIAFMLTVIPICWFMDVKGMRLSMLLSTFLILVGTGIRCISLEPTPATWAANICSVLNGVGGAVPFAGPPLMSSVWFPPNQRTTATAAISFANYFGVAMSFIIGPQIVRSPTYAPHNSTHHNFTSANHGSDLMLLYSNYAKKDENHTYVSNLAGIKSDVKTLLYGEAAYAAVLFVLIIIYFPARPPLPPSVSASVQRTDYRAGLASLARNGPLWLVIVAYALPSGVLGVWASVLDVNLKPLGISQTTVGYMGFWQTLAGALAGLVIAKFSDIFMRRMKLYLIVMFLGAILSCVWFTILCRKYIEFDLTSLYVSCILIGAFINGTIPLFYEIACEASYPVAEGITGGLLTLTNNVIGIAFLFVLLDNSIGTSWMNWVLLGSATLALPLLFVFPERYKRTDLDITVIVQSPEDGEVNYTEAATGIKA